MARPPLVVAALGAQPHLFSRDPVRRSHQFAMPAEPMSAPTAAHATRVWDLAATDRRVRASVSGGSDSLSRTGRRTAPATSQAAATPVSRLSGGSPTRAIGASTRRTSSMEATARSVNGCWSLPACGAGACAPRRRLHGSRRRGSDAAARLAALAVRRSGRQPSSCAPLRKLAGRRQLRDQRHVEPTRPRAILAATGDDGEK